MFARIYSFHEGIEKTLLIADKIFDKDDKGNKINFDKEFWGKNKNRIYYQKICLDSKCKKVHKHLRRAQVLKVASILKRSISIAC